MQWELSASAESQLWEISAYWDANRADARVRIEEALFTTISLILTNPYLAATDEATGIRRRNMRGTPYYIYYEIDEDRQVVGVAAVWDPRRGTPPPID